MHKRIYRSGSGLRAFILPFHGGYVSRSRCVIVTDIVEGGSLAANLARFHPLTSRWREFEAGAVIVQYMSAVHLMHVLKIAHRDIKDLNALMKTQFNAANFRGCAVGTPRAPYYSVASTKRCLRPGTLKLTDFGGAVAEADTKLPSCGEGPPFPGHGVTCYIAPHGTFSTMAPELVQVPDVAHPATFHVMPTDIFSLGQTWYKLLTGETLTAKLARAEIEAGRPRRQALVRVLLHWSDDRVAETLDEQHITGPLHTLLASMMKEDPDERPKIAEVLAHPYFSTIR